MPILAGLVNFSECAGSATCSASAISESLTGAVDGVVPNVAIDQKQYSEWFQRLAGIERLSNLYGVKWMRRWWR